MQGSLGDAPMPRRSALRVPSRGHAVLRNAAISVPIAAVSSGVCWCHVLGELLGVRLENGAIGERRDGKLEWHVT